MNHPASTKQAAYSILEVARIARLGRTSIYGAINRGELRARKLGSRTIILAEDFEAWLRSLPVVEPKAV